MPRKKRSKGNPERIKEYQKEYWERERERLLEERRERYRTDPEYRKRIQARARQRYWFEVRPGRRKEQPEVTLSSLESKGYIEVTVDDAKDVRHGETIKVPVYTSSQVAEMLGKSEQTIRLWLKQGVLPEPAYRGREMPGEYRVKGRQPRLFTYDEMAVLERCREFVGLPSKEKKQEIFSRCVREGFGKLVNGIEPKYA